MWTDPIVEEVRKNREEFAAQFNFDLEAMIRSLQESEKQSGRQVVSFAPHMDRMPLGQEEAKVLPVAPVPNAPA